VSSYVKSKGFRNAETKPPPIYGAQVFYRFTENEKIFEKNVKI